MNIRFRQDRKKKPWELDLGYVVVEGKRKRKFLYFGKKGEAEAEMSRKKGVVKSVGTRALSFSADEVERFTRARNQLDECGATIEEAVAYFRRHHVGLSERVTMRVLVDRAGEAMEKRAVDSGYSTALRRTWERFLLGREEMLATDVSSRDVSAWVNGFGWKKKTQRNYVGDLSYLFRWGMRRTVGLCTLNPCEDVHLDGYAGHEREITCLPVEWAAELLEATRRVWPEGLWYPVLGLFCGIRSKERQKMDASALHETHVEISPAIAKGRSRGLVTLPDAARRWLAVWKEAGGKEFGWSEDFWARVRWECGWDWVLADSRRPSGVPRDRRRWPRNVERHTFASMHYALHEDERQLKKEMRHHASEDTLFRHYRAVRDLEGRVITKEIAAGFWGMMPESK